MFADFAVRDQVRDALPVWDDFIPDELVPWTRLTYIFRRGQPDQAVYRLGDQIGEGSGGNVHALDPVNGVGTGFVLKSMLNETIFHDELHQAEAAGAELCRVRNRMQTVMRRGLDLEALLDKVSLKMDEVLAMLTAVLDVQMQLVAERGCVYTDVKCSNLILFRSPVEGCARVSFCDYGGLFAMQPEWPLDGVSTYPPPETGYCGWLQVFDPDWAVSMAVWWCGILFLEMFQMLDPEYFAYFRAGSHSFKQPIEREKHLDGLRKELAKKGLGSIASALSPDWRERLVWVDWPKT